jgi:lipoprotein-anchoring transpeptidase ErfK/SrfK
MSNRLIAAALLAAAAAFMTPAFAEPATRAERWRYGSPVIVPGLPAQIDHLNRRDFPVTLDGDAPPQHVDRSEHRAAIGSDYLNFIYGDHARSPRLPSGRSYIGPVGNGRVGARAISEGRSPRSGTYLAVPPDARDVIERSGGLQRMSHDRAVETPVAPAPRRRVAYRGGEKPGTVLIDTKARTLTLVETGGEAIRYSVGVGREGYGWKGVERVSQKREWPDWRPPADMLARRPDLPVHMAGGPDNPLGARALYLGSTLYRIHGSNEPETVGGRVSSGCIRMTNDDVIDLYERVPVGAKVVVL